MTERYYITQARPAGQEVPAGGGIYLRKEDAIAAAKTSAQADRTGQYDYYVLETVSVVHRPSTPVRVKDMGATTAEEAAQE